MSFFVPTSCVLFLEVNTLETPSLVPPPFQPGQFPTFLSSPELLTPGFEASNTPALRHISLGRGSPFFSPPCPAFVVELPLFLLKRPSSPKSCLSALLPSPSTNVLLSPQRPMNPPPPIWWDPPPRRGTAWTLSGIYGVLPHHRLLAEFGFCRLSSFLFFTLTWPVEGSPFPVLYASWPLFFSEISSGQKTLFLTFFGDDLWLLRSIT